jgi:hypothetical protein
MKFDQKEWSRKIRDPNWKPVVEELDFYDEHVIRFRSYQREWMRREYRMAGERFE